MTEIGYVGTPGRSVGVYQLTELIGQGGFSEVWSAWDTRLKRVVALKIIPIDDEASASESAARFAREALIVTRLEHHHILPLYDFGEEATFRYLVMRYATGGSLVDRLDHGVRLAPSEVLRLMTPIAAALDYLHEARVVHRDIKPGNILLDAQNTPYLADFGLAKTLSDDTQQIHSTAGTLVYMSPEQFRGDVLSAQSDQFSFGVMLFLLFTGSLPYSGNYVFAMRQLTNGESLPDVTESNPTLPQGLNDYLRQLTTADPAARPTHLGPILSAMAALFSDQPASTPENSVVAITHALESGVYRRREAEFLLEKYLPAWQAGKFTLNRTHFILLDMILSGEGILLTAESRSFMLRGALEYGHQIDRWWMQATDKERQRAAWDALNSLDGSIVLTTLSRITGQVWVSEIQPATLEKIGRRLVPISAFTLPALQFLETALVVRDTWLVDDDLSGLDENLAVLACATSSLGLRAARLIGRARRTRAAVALPATLRETGPLLTVYETAGNLPSGHFSATQTAGLTGLLALRQLTHDPLSILRRYPWALAGSVLSVALMIFVLFRGLTLTDTARVLNALGLGILYGAIYGLGVCLARHIGLHLTIAARWLRLLLAVLAGGAIVALGINLYQNLVYDDVIAPALAVSFGWLYVVGFVLSLGKPVWMQTLAGTAGVAGAYLIPWWLYTAVNNTDSIPFYFDGANPSAAVPLVIAGALLVAIITLGESWLTLMTGRLTRRNQRDVAMHTETLNVGTSAPSDNTVVV